MELMFPKPISEKKKPKGMMRKTPLRAKKKYQYRPKPMKKTESIMQTDKSRCYLCRRPNQYGLNGLEEHHAIEGNGRRPISEQYGLKVYVCGITCHREGPNSIHKNEEVALKVKQDAQRKFEETHTREEWIEAFTKNYL